MRETSARLMASSSAISMIHTPRICWAASLLPISASSSVNHSSPASTFNAVDFLAPCGPSRISMWSALAPGRMMRATAGDHPQRAEGAVERRVVGAEMGDGPAIETGMPSHARPSGSRGRDGCGCRARRP